MLTGFLIGWCYALIGAAMAITLTVKDWQDRVVLLLLTAVWPAAPFVFAAIIAYAYYTRDRGVPEAPPEEPRSVYDLLDEDD